jgi:hypothetical protein
MHDMSYAEVMFRLWVGDIAYLVEAELTEDDLEEVAPQSGERPCTQSA